MVLTANQQWATLQQAMQALTPLVSILASETAVVPPTIFRTYLTSLPVGPAASTLLSGLWETAQRLQGGMLTISVGGTVGGQGGARGLAAGGNPLGARLADVTAALVEVFRWLRQQPGVWGGGGLEAAGSALGLDVGNVVSTHGSSSTLLGCPGLSWGIVPAMVHVRFPVLACAAELGGQSAARCARFPIWPTA